MPAEIYGLDDGLSALLSIENFQGKFDVTSFIENLSARQLSITKSHADEPFEPKPLIRDFETALQKLNALKAQVSADIERNAAEVAQAEVAHNTRIRQLNAKFEVDEIIDSPEKS